MKSVIFNCILNISVEHSVPGNIENLSNEDQSNADENNTDSSDVVGCKDIHSIFLKHFPHGLLNIILSSMEDFQLQSEL